MKYDSRKFIDLIRATTSKWANWDPPREIKVGDVGKINRQTGEFDWQGNIYDESFQARFGDSLDINLQHAHLQPVTLERTDDYIAAGSRGVSVKDANFRALRITEQPHSDSDAHPAANLKLQVNCQFMSKCGAALVLYKPQLSCLPRDEQLMRLLRKFHGALNGKYIVTEVISCPAYVMVMSTQEGQNFSASLDANVPVPSGITVGGAAKASWTASAVHGIWRSGHHTFPIYCPLYKLKQPPPSFWQVISGRRNDTTQSDLIDNWEDAPPPWDPLDDEGEEDEIYDAALEGEELDWEK